MPSNATSMLLMSFLSQHASSGAEVKGIMAWSCSHGHTEGVCNIQGTCHVALRSASADTRTGASKITGASGSANGSVDVGMLDEGVGIATRGCDYDTYAFDGTGVRWIARDATGLASGGVDTRVVA
ncbi:hypothetical protein SLEP1_g31555 [Rubroshorea leprosula]|uniref:Uncharacterized protein n=1 Tax=Rubroshorea leprosula TaxID=152421 RepID=A0AAV5K8W2_9ROSI|nr:hypothetical protein SLEP1_g31555 [Rubroshorea leprosula]